jgi:hypothetical protein
VAACSAGSRLEREAAQCGVALAPSGPGKKLQKLVISVKVAVLGLGWSTRLTTATSRHTLDGSGAAAGLHSKVSLNFQPRAGMLSTRWVPPIFCQVAGWKNVGNGAWNSSASAEAST